MAQHILSTTMSKSLSLIAMDKNANRRIDRSYLLSRGVSPRNIIQMVFSLGSTAVAGVLLWLTPPEIRKFALLLPPIKLVCRRLDSTRAYMSPHFLVIIGRITAHCSSRGAHKDFIHVIFDEFGNTPPRRYLVPPSLAEVSPRLEVLFMFRFLFDWSITYILIIRIEEDYVCEEDFFYFQYSLSLVS